MGWSVLYDYYLLYDTPVQYVEYRAISKVTEQVFSQYSHA